MITNKHTQIYYGFSDYNKPRFTQKDKENFWLVLGVVMGLVAFCIIYL